MTIFEFLTTEFSSRVTYGDRWLTCQNYILHEGTEFQVHEQPYRKRVRCIYRGDSESEAVRILLEGENK